MYFINNKGLLKQIYLGACFFCTGWYQFFSIPAEIVVGSGCVGYFHGVFIYPFSAFERIEEKIDFLAGHYRKFIMFIDVFELIVFIRSSINKINMVVDPLINMMVGAFHDRLRNG